MTALIISNKIVDESKYVSYFLDYCEPGDLHFRYDLDSAKDFLINYLFEKQKHIDFVVTDWLFAGNNAKSLLFWLRNSEEIYSDRNFQIKSLPVLLVQDPNNYSSYIEDGFSAVISDFPRNHQSLSLAIKLAIKEWRSLVANELELIGLDPKTQRTHPNKRNNFISYYRLKVLTRHFVDQKSKHMSYTWATADLSKLDNSNEMYWNKMARTMRNPPKYLEKEFHDFFIGNPTFIKGEWFSTASTDLLYEKHFYKTDSKSYAEPDFINKPFDYSFRSPEIFEVKRQSQKIFRYRKERFTSKAKKSFEQVKRYRDYMLSEDPNNKKYIKRFLGQLYEEFEFALLMGSEEEIEEHQDLLNDLKRDFDFEEINLYTYEELLERHLRLCNRLREFNIF
jgi:hypothetical protein